MTPCRIIAADQHTCRLGTKGCSSWHEGGPQIEDVLSRLHASGATVTVNGQTARPVSTLGTLLADMSRDLAYAQRDGRAIGPVEAEYAARVANHFTTKE